MPYDLQTYWSISKRHESERVFANELLVFLQKIFNNENYIFRNWNEMNLYCKLKSFTIKFDYVISLKYMYVLSQKILHMMWNQCSWIFRIRWYLNGKFKYFFIFAPSYFYRRMSYLRRCEPYLLCTAVVTILK